MSMKFIDLFAGCGVWPWNFKMLDLRQLLLLTIENQQSKSIALIFGLNHRWYFSMVRVIGVIRRGGEIIL